MRSNLMRSGFVLISLVASATAGAQTVDEIVAMNLKAKGGAEKWSSVKAVKMTGKITMQGMEAPVTVYARRPNSNRQEVVFQGNKMIQAFDGTTAWGVNPVMGDAPQAAPPAIAEMIRNRADFDGALINYKEKGTTIALVGKEKLDGSEVYHLKVTTKGDFTQDYYLDAETGLERKTVAEVDMMGSGQKQTLEIHMADYKQVDGINLPHTIRQAVDGKPMVQMVVEKVELNPALDDALFSMPKK
jgi:outer membrane lipoprotein-sorting protein